MIVWGDSVVVVVGVGDGVGDGVVDGIVWVVVDSMDDDDVVVISYFVG